MTRPPVLAGALVALLFILVLPAAAPAATVTVRADGVLTFTSSTNERNVAAVEVRSGGEVEIADSVALTPVIASPCAVTGARAVCPAVTGLELRTGGGDDVITVRGVANLPVKV